MRSTRTTAAAAALLALTLLAGCGGGDDDKKSSDTVTKTVAPSPTETPATTEATSATTTAPVTPMDPTESGDITEAQVAAALLTPEEVGADFALGTYTDTEDPPLCDPNGTPLDQQFPPQVKSGTEIDHSSGQAVLLEEIAVYATESDAANAFTVGISGLTCNQGTLADGSTVDIAPPQDVTGQVNSASGLGNSTQYVITGDSVQGSLIVTLAGRILVVTTFQAAPDFDTSTLPNPVAVATDAFSKALAN